MRILIIGDTGFVGAAVARNLAAAGHHVTGISRSASGVAGTEHIVADRNDAARIAGIARESAIDVLIDTAAYTVESSASLLDALKGTIGRYVLLSSGDVYRNYGILHRRERGPAANALDEYSALRTSRHPYRLAVPRRADDPNKWLDGYDKIPVEEAVRIQNGFEWTILRLPMVYGPGEKQHRFRWVIGPMLTRASPLEFPRAWIDWRTTYGYIDNIAAGIALAATVPLAANKIYNLGDGETVPHSVWAKRFANAIPWHGAIHAGDKGDGQLLAAVRQLDLNIPIVVSSTRIREELGFAETVPLADALAMTVAEERKDLAGAARPN